MNNPRENPRIETGRLPVAARTEYHRVTILKVANGYIVEVGCMTFVSKDWQEISDGLWEYWANPQEAEKKFCK